MTIVFSCSILYWIVTKAPISEKLQIVQLITFTILSSLIIFDRTKGAWTISTMGWVTCLGLLGLSWNSLGAAFAEMSYAPYVLGLMLVANLALTLYYFRHPYIDVRVSAATAIPTVGTATTAGIRCQPCSRVRKTETALRNLTVA
ncbi:MAG: hypothetical protein EOP09_10875 [Proteobacteria bacterium]|nr:MAG: hypothetical protein EOP09_10875 [Pseudomonadota bacterium]